MLRTMPRLRQLHVCDIDPDVLAALQAIAPRTLPQVTIHTMALGDRAFSGEQEQSFVEAALEELSTAPRRR